jgi:hypothetical protein
MVSISSLTLGFLIASFMFIYFLHLLHINLVCCSWTLYLSYSPWGDLVYKL